MYLLYTKIKNILSITIFARISVLFFSFFSEHVVFRGSLDSSHGGTSPIPGGGGYRNGLTEFTLTVRNPGNVVPHSQHFVDEFTMCESAALELGCVVNDIKHVIVCGHSDCKAMNLLYALRDEEFASQVRFPRRGPESGVRDERGTSLFLLFPFLPGPSQARDNAKSEF